jgi:hypothetical protein
LKKKISAEAHGKKKTRTEEEEGRCFCSGGVLI